MKKHVFLFLGMLLACCMGAHAAEKIQVWDFGAEQLDETVYQNMLSVDEINSWYPAAIVPGTGNTPFPAAFTASEGVNLRWEGNGKTNHRLRTVNKALTRYDDKSLQGSDGKTYTGYVYSNSGNTTAVYLAAHYEPNDRIELWVGSNGNAAQYRFLAPDGNAQFGDYSAKSKLEKLTFYAAAAGEYQLACSSNEKLVVARILRYPAKPVGVSGAVSAPADLPADTKLLFTNRQTGGVTQVEIAGRDYTAQLAAGYDYTVSLLGAKAFVVENKNLTIAYEQESAVAHDINIAGVDLVTLTGSVAGLAEEALGKLAIELEKPADKVFQPEFALTGTAYELTLESGVEYAVRALHVNDYQLGMDKISASADGTRDFVFTLKPLYNITIAPTGAAAADLAEAVFTFTNLKEEGYSYSFTGTEGIRLRDGVYGVQVGNSGIYTQLLTSNLTVSGADAVKTIDFISEVTSWDFKGAEYQTGKYTGSFQGLTITGGKAHSGGGMSIKNGSITVPVGGPANIEIGTDYEWSYYIEEGNLIEGKSGSTTQKDTYTYSYTGGAGEVVITFTNSATSYVWSIEVIESVSYQPTIEVGADKACATIGEALTLIRKMQRDNPAEQPVTVMIAPGNYEEMLVVDRDNVRFVNAAAAPSIALRDKGVHIDEQAVRITSYYGHGYNYASMGDDFKWDARTLQVNKENGYPSAVNGGGAATTYWNATVVIEGKDFYAENIIFENSYNQYISAKEAADLVVEADGGKGTRPTTEGSTDVQRRSFRERAAALAMTKNSDRTFLNNCRIVGRQDSFYGAESRVACYKGVLMGACDYLFGEMNLTCYDTELALLTDEDKNDVAYITAPKTAAGKRGMLFYACRVTSAEPGVDMNEGQPSKPGLWGRPWAGSTSEAVFAGCRVEASGYNGVGGDHTGKSLIAPAGWDSGLSSASERCGEWGCNDNTDGRVEWAVRFGEPKTADGVEFTLFNWTKGGDDWDPFADYGVDTKALPEALPNDFPTWVASPAESGAGVDVFSRGKEVFVTNVVMPTDIQIYGMDGRLVSAHQVQENACIALPVGFYVLRADNDGGRTVGKVMIR